LDLDDVDDRNQTIKVTGKGNKQRIIPFTAKTQKNPFNIILPFRKEIISQSESHEHALLLNNKGKRLTPSTVNTTCKKISFRCDGNSKESPHVLRHSFATHLLD